jgi:hypothetical protein
VSRWDDVKRIKDTAKAKIDEMDFAKLASDAVVGASALADGAESVAKRSGLTKQNGEISKFKVAKAVVRPHKSVRKVIDATAEEVQTRRDASASEPPAG